MYKESLTKDTESVLNLLAKSGLTEGFYLAGGTALALQLGHRFSVDLDWFSPEFDYTPSFRRRLEKLGELSVDDESEHTFSGSLNGVLVSFFQYQYPLISPLKDYKSGVSLAGLPDIVAMKMEAVAARGSYKDFIDIYFLLQEYSLIEMLGFVRKKFTGLEYNEAHLLKSLTYFEDASGTDRPKMIKRVEWADVEKEIDSRVQRYTRSL